ncbi:MAG: hypothetical protein R2881_10315 [Eubacteriales bacterium]
MHENKCYIGCHLEQRKGLPGRGRVALSIGANTSVFHANPRGGSMKAIDPADAQALLTLCRENDFGTLVAHAPYTLNPSSSDAKVRTLPTVVLARI